MGDQINMLRLRRADSCGHCGNVVPDIQISSPGASLDREYERRSHARRSRVRARHPIIGGLLLALIDEPPSTRAFATGAEGERMVAAKLEKLCGEDLRFLHNRRRGPAARSGDIDHIAIAASGVYVIDAKHYKDAKVRVRRTGGSFTPGECTVRLAFDRCPFANVSDRKATQVGYGAKNLVDVSRFLHPECSNRIVELIGWGRSFPATSERWPIHQPSLEWESRWLGSRRNLQFVV